MRSIYTSTNYLLAALVVDTHCVCGNTIQRMAELGPGIVGAQDSSQRMAELGSGIVGAQDSWKNCEWKVFFDIRRCTYQRYDAWSDDFKRGYGIKNVSILPGAGTTRHIDGFKDLLEFARGNLCPDVYYAKPMEVPEAELGALIMAARERGAAESRRVEKEMIVRAFEEARGSLAGAAKLFQTSRESLRSRMRELGLKKPGRIRCLVNRYF